MTHVLIGIIKDLDAEDGERIYLLSDNLERDSQTIGMSPREYKIAMMEFNPQFDGIFEQDKYQFDVDGNEYWIGRDGRKHYTRDEG